MKKKLIVAGVTLLAAAAIFFAVFSAATSRSKISDFADIPSEIESVSVSAGGVSKEVTGKTQIDALAELIQAVRIGPHANLGYYYETPATIVPDCEIFLLSSEQTPVSIALLKADRAKNSGSIRLTDRYGRLMEVYGTADESYFALLDRVCELAMN